MMNEVDWWGLETQHSDTVTRDELKTSLAAAIARAEAAEATQVETLENILQALGVDPNEIDEIYLEQTAIGCINALSARVSELEQDCSNAY